MEDNMHGHSHTFRHIASDVKKTNIVEFET
jgi:hypothetical protein